MLKNQAKMLQICKELLPGINIGATTTAAAAVTKINPELSAIVSQIYKKYFAATVLASSMVNCRDTACSASFLHSLKINTNQIEPAPPAPDDVWIFGYGSLVWKADFPFIDRRQGFIRGYQRRFYQNSIDHRGTQENPGRVVTLLPTTQPEDRVYGVAYRIAAHQKMEVLSHLDYREKNGYQRCSLQFQEFPEESCGRFNIIMYIATPENESYAGAVWQLKQIAEQIFSAAGPSGPNREYLFHLANAMRVLFPGVEDKHLFDLEKEVQRRIEIDEACLLERAVKKEIFDILSKAVDLGEKYKGENELLLEFNKLRENCSKPGWKQAVLAKEPSLLNAGTI